MHKQQHVFPKNLIPWRDSNPGLLFPETHTMPTAPRRPSGQGCFLHYLEKIEVYVNSKVLSVISYRFGFFKHILALNKTFWTTAIKFCRIRYARLSNKRSKSFISWVHWTGPWNHWIGPWNEDCKANALRLCLPTRIEQSREMHFSVRNFFYARRPAQHFNTSFRAQDLIELDKQVFFVFSYERFAPWISL
jgi:hypothetical protein